MANKHLIDEQLWSRLVARIVKDESMELSLAERIMDQALAFLALCAREPQGRYSPSEFVDVGWHTFILYTKAYADFCQKVAGRFIHHNPSDVPGVDYRTGNIARTVEALKGHGFVVDEMLWIGHRVPCDQETCKSCSNECDGS
ncbi:MAG TPA: hypothetical protein VFH06_04545 [Candidatus Saccharimonadales bacterium]|nr:hypothetical protein [Candidatus Saccharimonadales bacterium]